MKVYRLPPVWDARKFAARYGLDFTKDYYVDASGGLVVFPTLPDDPPIFDQPDPQPATPPDTTFTNGVASKNPLGFIVSRGPDGTAIYTPYYK